MTEKTGFQRIYYAFHKLGFSKIEDSAFFFTETQNAYSYKFGFTSSLALGQLRLHSFYRSRFVSLS